MPLIRRLVSCLLSGQLRLIMFGGRVLTYTEQRHATIDKELLACYFALKRCEIYILGYAFIVYTDHKTLLCLSAFKDVLNKRFRWIQYMESLGTCLRYFPGNQNVVASSVKWSDLAHSKKTQGKSIFSFPCTFFLHIFDT